MNGDIKIGKLLCDEDIITKRQLNHALQSQITLRKNKGKKVSKTKTFNQKVNAKFDELITMLKKADPNVFKKDFDLIKYIAKLEKPKLK